jgi:hypothetical protein
MALLVAGTTLNAQQIIESRVGTDALVSIPGDSPTEVTHIDLPAGNWLVSGQINFYESAETGTVFVGGNISETQIGLSTNGTTLFTSQQLDHPTNIVLGIALPPRIVRVGQDPHVFLVAYSVQPGQPAPVCFAWGFISAQRLRTNDQQ